MIPPARGYFRARGYYNAAAMGKARYRLQSVLNARERQDQDAARVVALRRSQLERT